MTEFLFEIAMRHRQIIKYVISGSTATFVDLSFIYVLTDLFHFWYLLSAVLAFMIAFFVSFSLQKFWTFRNNDRERIYEQLVLYLTIGLLNLTVNTGLMYLSVDVFGVWYLFAQVIILGFLGIGSFLFYKYIIFKKHKSES